MGESSQESGFLSKVGQFLELLKEVLFLYGELLPVIQREHELLQDSDMEELEILTKNKSRISEKLIQTTMALQRLVYGETNRDTKKVSSLSELVAALEENSLKGFQEKIFKHTFAEIRSIAEQIIVLRKDSEGIVQMNIYLTRKLLAHHRDTFRFWVKVAGNANGVYDSSGSQDIGDIASLHQTKV